MPLASSKKPYLASALWPLALWHMHMAALDRALARYVNASVLPSALSPCAPLSSPEPASTEPSDHCSSTEQQCSVDGSIRDKGEGGGEGRGGSAGVGCGGGAAQWLVVEGDGKGENEEYVRKACERLHSSCMAAGGLGGGGEADSLLDARIASTVWCLSSWAALIKRAEAGGGVNGGVGEGGVKGAAGGRSGRDVLQNVLDARDSKDVLDWNTITAGLLSQVLIATASSIYRRKKSCYKLLSSILAADGQPLGFDMSAAARLLPTPLASLLGSGGGSSAGVDGGNGGASTSSRGGERENGGDGGEERRSGIERGARESRETLLSNIIVAAEEELRLQFVGEERNRSERERERDKVEAEIAGKLHDDARLLTSRWQSHERRRREAATQGKRERALSGRKSWRHALKACCHEQSIWRPYLSYATAHGDGQTERERDSETDSETERQPERDAMPALASVFGEERLHVFQVLAPRSQRGRRYGG